MRGYNALPLNVNGVQSIEGVFGISRGNTKHALLKRVVTHTMGQRCEDTECTYIDNEARGGPEVKESYESRDDTFPCSSVRAFTANTPKERGCDASLRVRTSQAVGSPESLRPDDPSLLRLG